MPRGSGKWGFLWLAASLLVLSLALRGALPVLAEKEPPQQSPAAEAQRQSGRAALEDPALQKQIQAILSRPPLNFSELLEAVPFYLYEKGRDGNYVAFGVGKDVNWDVVGQLTPEEIESHVRFVCLFFWFYVDRRPDSRITVVVDADGFSFGRVLSGGVKTVLLSIVNGLESTVPFVGERGGTVFLINTPGYLKPIIEVVTALVGGTTDLRVFGPRDPWKQALETAIGTKHLPVAYGGTNRTPINKSSAMQYIRNAVLSILAQRESAAAAAAAASADPEGEIDSRLS